MLLASYFILNRYGILLGSDLVIDYSMAPIRTDEIRKHKLYPYVHSFSNAPTREGFFGSVMFPHCNSYRQAYPHSANLSQSYIVLEIGRFDCGRIIELGGTGVWKTKERVERWPMKKRR